MTAREALIEALWQAWLHGELDLANIDGNDHPDLASTAERLIDELDSLGFKVVAEEDVKE